MIFRIAHVDLHGRVPAIRDGREPRVERCTQTLNQVGQWVAEVLVLAASEAVRAMTTRLRNKESSARYSAPSHQAFAADRKSWEQSASLIVQILPDQLPIECVDTGDRLISWNDLAFRCRELLCGKGIHAWASLPVDARCVAVEGAPFLTQSRFRSSRRRTRLGRRWFLLPDGTE